MNLNYIKEFKILLTLIFCTIPLQGMEQEPKRLKIDKVELVRQKGLSWYLVSRIYKGDQPVFAEHIVDKIMYYAKPTLIKNEKEKLLSLFASLFVPQKNFGSSDDLIAFSSDSQKLITNSGNTIGQYPVYSSDCTKLALFLGIDRFYHFQIGDLKFYEKVPVSAAVFSSDNKLLACGRWNNSISLWDLETNEHTVFFYGLAQLENDCLYPICSLAFSHDGKQLASSSKDGLLLWDVKSKTCCKLSEDTGIEKVVFRPKTQQLVSGSTNGTLQFWDLETHQCIQSFLNIDLQSENKDYHIFYIEFPADGMQMIVGATHMLSVWDVRTGISIILNKDICIQKALVSPDGNYIASKHTAIIPALPIVSRRSDTVVYNMRGFNKFGKKLEDNDFTMEELTLFKKKYAPSSLSLTKDQAKNQDLKIKEIMKSCVE